MLIIPEKGRMPVRYRTRMYTRHELLSWCKELRTAQQGDKQWLAVLAVGVDRFARVRGAIGYGLAEKMIGELSRRIDGFVNSQHTARLAPDCIGVAVTVPGHELGCAQTLSELHSALEQPMVLEGHKLHVAIRFGYALWNSEELSATDVLHQAEMALDQARESARPIQLFSTEEYGDPLSRLILLDELGQGLSRDEMQLLYQPQVRTRTGEVAGVEALIRWNHPVRGQVPPNHFIPTAEETGQIRDITEWTIARALDDADTLAAAGYDLRIGVNISSRLLGDPNFLETTERLVRGRSGKLTFEITESSEIHDWPLAIRILRTMSNWGIRISIDDYGSGMSSLAYVQQLPAHELKIDRLFVTQLTSSHRDPLLVRSTIELGHALELEVVAEGIQDPETLALLSMMGCDLVQGYFIGVPQPLDQLLTYLDQDVGRERTMAANPAALLG